MIILIKQQKLFDNMIWGTCTSTILAQVQVQYQVL